MTRLYDRVIRCVLTVLLMDILAVALMRLRDRGVDRLDRQWLVEVGGYGDMLCFTGRSRADLKSVQRGPPYHQLDHPLNHRLGYRRPHQLDLHLNNHLGCHLSHTNKPVSLPVPECP